MANAAHAPSSEAPPSPPPRQFRCAEFFSGIGGMHYALQRVMPASWELHVDACDINTLANKIYQNNFGHKPRTFDLNLITAQMLDDLKAELWCLSPPCQPYTTTLNAQQRDASDPRAKSLLRILQQLPSMSHPPEILILENVEGFAGSQVHQLLKSTLASCGYHLQEFLVSPHQLGIPYFRARYFALASRQPFRHAGYNGQLIRHPPALLPDEVRLALSSPLIPAGAVERLIALCNSAAGSADHQEQQPVVSTQQQGTPQQHSNQQQQQDSQQQQQHCQGSTQAAAAALEAMSAMERMQLASTSQLQWPPCSFAGSQDIRPVTQACLPLGHFLEYIEPQDEASWQLWQEYAVTEPALAKFWKSYDVVTASSTHSNCVTKNYTRTVAAGSVVATPKFLSLLCSIDGRGRAYMPHNPLLRCGSADAACASVDDERGENHGAADCDGATTPTSATNSATIPDPGVLQELRFLTPREVANLHGFPCQIPQDGRGNNGPACTQRSSFCLPASTVTARQAYGVLGNSLSVDVFAWLLCYLLATSAQGGQLVRC